MLPQNGIAQEGHAPNTNVIDFGMVRYGKVSCIVTQCAKEPTKEGQEEGSEDGTLLESWSSAM
jgi:hypothetical protein